MWRTSSTLLLIAQRTATSGHSTVVLLQTLWFFVNQMRVVVSLGNALHVGSKSCLYEFTELNFMSVGSHGPVARQDIKYIYWLTDWLIDWLIDTNKASCCLLTHSMMCNAWRMGESRSPATLIILGCFDSIQVMQGYFTELRHLVWMVPQVFSMVFAELQNHKIYIGPIQDHSLSLCIRSTTSQGFMHLKAAQARGQAEGPA